MFSSGETILLTVSIPVLTTRLTLKQRPELIADGPINHIPGSRVPALTKQQFSATVAVNIYGVDQLISRQHVQMLVVGGLAEDLVKVAVNILPRYQCREELD